MRLTGPSVICLVKPSGGSVASESGRRMDAADSVDIPRTPGANPPRRSD
jgi:hypothetical protein